jgi:hypothetical protein
VECRAAPDQEREGEQQPWRGHTGKGGEGQCGGNQQHEALGGQHHPAAIEVVGHRPSKQSEQHDRQGDRRLHQCDHVGARSNGNHQP